MMPMIGRTGAGLLSNGSGIAQNLHWKRSAAAHSRPCIRANAEGKGSPWQNRSFSTRKPDRPAPGRRRPSPTSGRSARHPAPAPASHGELQRIGRRRDLRRDRPEPETPVIGRIAIGQRHIHAARAQRVQPVPDQRGARPPAPAGPSPRPPGRARRPRAHPPHSSSGKTRSPRQAPRPPARRRHGCRARASRSAAAAPAHRSAHPPPAPPTR
jgi:hypothetical protein